MQLPLRVFFLIISVLISTAAFAQKAISSSEDSLLIKTKHWTVDFGSTTDQLKTLQNTAKTPAGIRAEDPASQSLVVSDAIAVPVDSVAPFLAVGSHWVIDASNENVEQLNIEIRSSANQTQWSEWTTLNKDDHLTVSRDTLVTALMYLPETTKFIQFRLTLSDVEVQSARFSFTSPGVTSTEVLQNITEKSSSRKSKSPVQNQKYPMPEYTTRTEWGCPDGQNPSGSVSLTDVTHQIIHHSAGTNTSSDWPAVIRSIWDYHVNTNGWSDVGYNWLIDPNGVIYQGRGWINGNDEVQGAHFCGTNSNTMGISMLGNFEEANPSVDALNALEELLAWKSDEKNIDPTGQSYHSSSGLSLYRISGHRDGCSTLCPGENLYLELPEVRKGVNTKIEESATEEKNITLDKVYPNPLWEEATIEFTLDKAGQVRITIWDVTGRFVQEVQDQFYEAGEQHTEIWHAANYASGTYFCRLEFEDQSVVQQLVLLK